MHLHALSTGEVTAASYVPLWAADMLTPTTATADAVRNSLPSAAYNLSAILVSLQSSQLLQIGGLLTSTEQTGQQWDFPNSWPPLVFMIQQGLLKTSLQSLQDFPTQSSQNLAADMARNISDLWLATNYAGYSNTSYMFEKYDAMIYGGGGGGGEYTPQVGFGWTNGVALALLNQTYSAIPPPPIAPNAAPNDDAGLSLGA